MSRYLRACACGCVEAASDGRLQQDAHKAMENFWQSVDQQDASKTKAVAATDIAQPAVPTGIERHRCSENIFFFLLPKLGRPHFHIRQGNGEIEKSEPVKA